MTFLCRGYQLFYFSRLAVAKVVQAPVEVNHIPLGVAQPAVEGGKTAVGISTVGFGPADECFDPAS